jgi:hypothetical protein
MSKIHLPLDASKLDLSKQNKILLNKGLCTYIHWHKNYVTYMKYVPTYVQIKKVQKLGPIL